MCNGACLSRVSINTLTKSLLCVLTSSVSALRLFRLRLRSVKKVFGSKCFMHLNLGLNFWWLTFQLWDRFCVNVKKVFFVNSFKTPGESYKFWRYLVAKAFLLTMFLQILSWKLAKMILASTKIYFSFFKKMFNRIRKAILLVLQANLIWQSAPF